MDFVLDLDQLKSLIIAISRVYSITHDLIKLLAISLIWGGLYAMFSQSKRGFGYLGIDPNKHGIGLGISMFVAGSLLMVLEGFIAIFTFQFGQVASPLSILSDTTDVISGANNQYHILYVRFFGLYFVWLGYFFCGRGLYHAAGAGSNQISGSKKMLFSFLGGIALILIGKVMAAFGG